MTPSTDKTAGDVARDRTTARAAVLDRARQGRCRRTLLDGFSPRAYTFRKHLGRPLRVGGIDYLNSRPLVECFDEVAGDEVELENHAPSELARLLRRGELDVALVPVVEYFTSHRAGEYWIVPGVGISSWGSVESIRLYHRVPLGEVRRVVLDRTSMTSRSLTRLLFRERPSPMWRRHLVARDKAVRAAPLAGPAFEEGDPARIVSLLEDDARDGLQGRRPGVDHLDDVDAALLIGDSALRVSPARHWSSIDLGLEWTRWLGLPFVYAVWVFQGEPIPGLTACFQHVRRSGCARIDAIVDRGPLPPGMPRHECLRYLIHVIRYGFGPNEKKGLLEFIRRLQGHKLISSPLGGQLPELRFLDGIEPDRADSSAAGPRPGDVSSASRRSES